MSLDPANLPESVRAFRPTCPGCVPSAVTADGAKPCSAFDCPGLPSELKVTCDLCMYDFANAEGQIKCDHRTCETARTLRRNVPTYRAWLQHVSG